MTSGARKRSILIIEDEEAISDGLVDVFTFHGYQVTHQADGKEGLECALQQEFDLIILDVMLPSLDGFEVCERIKNTKPDQAIIMLTAKAEEQDVITGFTLGADDYLAKPFSVRELVLRVESLLRRCQKLIFEQNLLKLTNGIVIDCLNLKANFNQSEIRFTRREVDILLYLSNNSERPVSREELLEEVWDYKKGSGIETRTVDIHVAKLRRKVEVDPKDPQIIVTIRGKGYKLV